MNQYHPKPCMNDVIDRQYCVPQAIFMDVVESESSPQWSGLYDSHGAPLFREKPKFPIGFRGKS